MCKRVSAAFGYITDGMINSLKDAGHSVSRWDGLESSWYEFDPDIFLGASGHQQPIPDFSSRGSCKVAIHTNPHGPLKIEPNINETNENIQWVIKQKPDAIFGYGHESDRKLWSYWESMGVQWVSMPTAGDATIFRPHFNSYENRDLDFVYVGGRWKYKAKVIDQYLFPVLWKSNLNYELWGWGDWPDKVCMGRINDDDKPKLYARAKCAPCVSEPHTLQYGIDLPERVFKAILSGCVVIHDPVPGLDRYVPSLIVANSPNDYLKMIKKMARMPDDQRKEIAISQYNEVIGGHTYHHRMACLFDAIGFSDEASDMLLALEKYERPSQLSHNSG